MILVTVFVTLNVSAKIPIKLDSRMSIQSIHPNIIKHKNAVAAMIPKKWIVETKIKNKFLLTYKSLHQQKNFCKDELYSNQMAISKCSSVLIAEDIILTAAHCLDLQNVQKSCQNNYWVFDYNKLNEENISSLPNSNNVKFSKELLTKNKNIFECEQVLHYEFKKNVMDFALIKLKNKANRRPVQIQKSTINFGPLLSLGFPNGVPLKGNSGSFIKDNLTTAFTNMFAPIGSSGSPIFSEENGKLQGIIISSIYNHEMNQEDNCIRETIDNTFKPMTLYNKMSAIHDKIVKFVIQN